MIKRLAIAFFYDEEGIVDDYFLHLIKSLQPFVSKTIFVSNGSLSRDSEMAVKPLVEEIIIRDNSGFDVWAYKTGIESVGYENLGEYDELLLYNHTFYGPIYPFSEMFEEMEKRKSLDFWGITIHKEMTPNPFTGQGHLPRHINSHFIAIRKPMLTSLAFRRYWETMPEIGSYNESVLKHESRFSDHFSKLKYKYEAYQNPDDYGSDYPCFINIEETIKNRIPILKRRLFFHESLFHEAHAINLPKAIDIIRETSDYDLGLVWRNIARGASPRILNTNAALMSVLPDQILEDNAPNDLRIAVCAHVFYVELLDELLSYSRNIGNKYDFIATTDTSKKKRLIEARLKKEVGIGNSIVRVVSENRGRDMAALFISCKDIFQQDNYDLVCRIHTKKSPQVSAAQGLLFKNHLLENLLNSPGYVANVIDLFRKNPVIGIAIAPIIHISFMTMGYSWFSNKEPVKDLLRKIDVKVPLDEDTPLAPYGSMFWFRPKALQKLFDRNWKLSDFPTEGNYRDGDLPHALERAIVYVAQDAGYLAHQIMSPRQAAFNYTMLEYKLQKMLTHSPVYSFFALIEKMRIWKANGHPIMIEANGNPVLAPVVEVNGNSLVGARQPLLKESIVTTIGAAKRSLHARAPSVFYVLRPFYRIGRNLMSLVR
ncbi:rhamnan synthesis F family protein [Mesorhizobium sp. WSM3626]|uniref:rhamnan synthesis F family protein n=1 Tax=Mesorhizobium sp. WSM3626 TaxID=1040987 RepID=UPI0004B2F523|nr:rhamnan synthesis F family protein [Mesorhizobium sp. WSM3626]